MWIGLIILCLIAYAASRAVGYLSEHTEHGRHLGLTIRNLIDW